MNASPNKVLNSTACLSLQQLKFYHEDRLNSKEKHGVENHLLDCELCSNALAGFAIVPISSTDISDINKRIDSISGASYSGLLSSKLFIALTLVVAIFGTTFFVYKTFFSAATPILANNQPENKISSLFTSGEPPKNTIVVNAKDTEMQNALNSAKANIAIPDAVTVYPNEAFAADIEMMPTGNILEITIDKKKLNDEILKKKNITVRDTFIYDLKITDYERYYYVNIDALKATNKSTEAVFANDDEKLNPGDFKIDDWRIITTAHVLKKGLKKFNAQDYENAVKLLNILVNYDANDVNALFYGGVCYVNLGQADKAIEYLDKVLQSENSSFLEEAKWYKALAYAKKNDFVTAKKLLDEIVLENGFYAEQAKEKLKEL